MTKKIKFIEGSQYAGDVMGYPTPASKHVPKWYKDIPPSRGHDNIPENVLGKYTSTVKQCTPFLDALTSGYTVCLPHDIGITLNPDGSHTPYWGVDRQPRDSVFSPDQKYRVDGIAIPEGYNETVWRTTVDIRVSLPSGYSLLVTHPLNRYDLPFLVFSGVVDYDKYTIGALVANMVLRKNFEGVLEKGTPILQIIPFKREDWESETAPYSQQDHIKQSFLLNSKLIRSYQYNFWSKKSYK